MARTKRGYNLTLNSELAEWAKEEAWKQRTSLSTYIDRLIEQDRAAKEADKQVEENR